MYSTQLTRHVKAPPGAVFKALVDPEGIAKWRVPEGMTSRVHEFDARQGGTFRVTLTYDTADSAGKSGAHTDTYHGRFVELVPGERVVEEMEFETDDPAMRGVMTMTTTLTPVPGGTRVAILHEGIPDAVPRGDNETGTRMALIKLAQLVEANGPVDHPRSG